MMFLITFVNYGVHYNLPGTISMKHHFTLCKLFMLRNCPLCFFPPMKYFSKFA